MVSKMVKNGYWDSRKAKTKTGEMVEEIRTRREIKTDEDIDAHERSGTAQKRVQNVDTAANSLIPYEKQRAKRGVAPSGAASSGVAASAGKNCKDIS